MHERLKQVPWDWSMGRPESPEVVILWVSGDQPLARVAVDEDAEVVRIGVYERWPDGTEKSPAGVVAVADTRCVRVRLNAMLGSRRVVDSLDDAVPGRRRGRGYEVQRCKALARRIEAERLECAPAPDA